MTRVGNQPPFNVPSNFQLPTSAIVQILVKPCMLAGTYDPLALPFHFFFKLVFFSFSLTVKCQRSTSSIQLVKQPRHEIYIYIKE